MKALARVSLIVAAGLIASPAFAQVASKKVLTLEGAKRAIAAAVAAATKAGATGVIAVVDDGGNLMALERIDGTFAAGGVSGASSAQQDEELAMAGAAAVTSSR